jgi:hypothetical protein
MALNAIRELRGYLQTNRRSKPAKVLAKLAVALADERDFPLADLYQLPMHEFELAIALMQDWRLDRYYVSRLRLFDLVVNEVLAEEAST